jgi:hypothetical protein
MGTMKGTMKNCGGHEFDCSRHRKLCFSFSLCIFVSAVLLTRSFKAPHGFADTPIKHPLPVKLTAKFQQTLDLSVVA